MSVLSSAMIDWTTWHRRKQRLTLGGASADPCLADAQRPFWSAIASPGAWISGKIQQAL
jgi:hypothetical protein